MTDEQLDALEAAAKGATKGEWHCRRRDVFSRTANGDFPVVYDARYERDANYVAAANPVAILELIAELRQVRRERDWLAEKMEEGTNCCLPENEECACSFCSDCEYNTQESWLEAAKEATCQK